MKSFVLLMMAAALVSCAGSQPAKKKEDAASKIEAAKAAAQQAQAQMDEQLAVAKKENEEAKEEMVTKKEMLDKSKSEKALVMARLVKMGFAAEVVRVRKTGDVFTYEDNTTRPALETVKDIELLTRLDDIVEKQKIKDNDALDTYNRCEGGMQTCVDGRMYLLYMEKSGDGTCKRSWHLVDRECR